MSDLSGLIKSSGDNDEWAVEVVVAAKVFLQDQLQQQPKLARTAGPREVAAVDATRFCKSTVASFKVNSNCTVSKCSS
jgi:hypothetical protein